MQGHLQFTFEFIWMNFSIYWNTTLAPNSRRWHKVLEVHSLFSQETKLQLGWMLGIQNRQTKSEINIATNHKCILDSKKCVNLCMKMPYKQPISTWQAMRMTNRSMTRKRGSTIWLQLCPAKGDTRAWKNHMFTAITLLINKNHYRIHVLGLCTSIDHLLKTSSLTQEKENKLAARKNRHKTLHKLRKKSELTN